MRVRVSVFTSACLLFALAGCTPGSKDSDTDDTVVPDSTPPEDTYIQPVDGDGDGVTIADGDCDDEDATIGPLRPEVCDGVDNNCNGSIDEGLPDTDGDTTADCLDAEDCDGIDNDGDGETDETFGDADGDGVADCVGTERCDGLDNNGDGDVDEGYDADFDGYTQCGSSTRAADCDDAAAGVYPGAAEVDGDFVDNDCDGLIDNGNWAEGDLAISEIMNNPGAVGDPDGEWFEVYNTTDRTLILNGLVITDSGGSYHRVADASILSVEPGEFFVFGSNATLRTNGNAPVDYAYSRIVLSNESDDLTITADGVHLDTVAWDDGLSMPDPAGASMGNDLGNYGADINDDPTAWCAAIRLWTDDPTADRGSPGAENEYCSTYDHDQDGYTGDQGDCDDADPTIYPGAFEGTDPADNDCDGVAETVPYAVPSATSDGFSCSDIQLDGSASYDLEGSAVSYAWELSGAPASSARTTADITTPTSMAPTFNPDVPGTYTFTLTVNDGGTDSAPASVDVTVDTRPTNADPVAAAGADQSGSGSATCTPISYGVSYDCNECADSTYDLDATGSSDADGDVLSHAWAVTSGGTYGTLSAASGSTTTLTVSGITAVYTTGATETVTVELTTTDCMGAVATDTVDVVYVCTGA